MEQTNSTNSTNSNKQTNSEFSLEPQMTKFKLSCFEHNVQRPGSIEKPVMVGREEKK